MIYFIRGVLAAKTDGGVVIENGGVGYEILVPGNSPVYMLKEGEETKIYTYMAVKEDDVTLYGFTDAEAMKLFKLLITVNGVGAKAAMALLSSMPSTELCKAIAFEDATALTKANGVGKKTAQRIVLELKEKMGGLSVRDAGLADFVPTDSDLSGDGRSDALNGLMALGYSRLEAVNALASVKETGLTSEQYIRLALKKLF